MTHFKLSPYLSGDDVLIHNWIFTWQRTSLEGHIFNLLIWVNNENLHRWFGHFNIHIDWVASLEWQMHITIEYIKLCAQFGIMYLIITWPLYYNSAYPIIVYLPYYVQCYLKLLYLPAHAGGTRSQRGRLCPYYRSRLCPYYRGSGHSCARLRSRLCPYYKQDKSWHCEGYICTYPT